MQLPARRKSADERDVRHAHLPASHVTIVSEDPGAIRGRAARRGFRNKSCSLFLKIRCASRAYD